MAILISLTSKTATSATIKVDKIGYHAVYWSYFLNGQQTHISYIQGNDFSYIIPYLTPNTEYMVSFRSYGKDQENRDDSNTISFSTMALPPVINISISNIKTTSVTVTGTADQNCGAWQYSLDGGSWQSLGPASNAKTESKEITGLSANTPYSVRVRATSWAGSQTGTSSPANFTTLGTSTLTSVDPLVVDASSPKLGFAWTVEPGTGYTNTIHLKVGAATLVTRTGLTGSTGNKSIELTPAEVTALLALLPDITSISGTLELLTMDGATQVGSTSSKPITIQTSQAGSAPIIGGLTLTEGNPTVAALVTEPKHFIRLLSTIKAGLTGVQFRNGASAVSYGAKIGARTVMSASPMIDFVGPELCGDSIMIEAFVDDSRGYRTTVTDTINIRCYKKPAILTWRGRRADSIGEDVSLEFLIGVDAYQNADLQALEVRYREAGTEIWSAWEALSWGEAVEDPAGWTVFESITPNWQVMDPEKTYRCEVKAQDNLDEWSEVLSFTIQRGIPLMSFRDQKIGINQSEPEAALDVTGQIMASQAAIQGDPGETVLSIDGWRNIYNPEQIFDDADDIIDTGWYQALELHLEDGWITPGRGTLHVVASGGSVTQMYHDEQNFVLVRAKGASGWTAWRELVSTDKPGSPTQISGLTATAGDETVSLSWTNPEGGTFYGLRIIRKAGALPDNITDGTLVYLGVGESYKDDNLTNGTVYYYRAFAHNLYGIVNDTTTGATANATPYEIMSPQINSLAGSKSGHQQASLTWTNPVDDNFKGVKIQRKTGGYPTMGDDGTTVYDGLGSSTTDTGLVYGTQYYYRAFAYNRHGTYTTTTAGAQMTLTIQKESQTAPAAPTMASRTDVSITLNSISGCEYRIGGSAIYQDSRTFTGLSPATAYSFYARKKETETHAASPDSVGGSITTDKSSQTAPSAPTMASRTGVSITLNAISGCEYKRGAGEFQDSTVFGSLSPVTSYTFYARKKATSTHYASPDSAGAAVSTTKADQTAPAAPTRASYTETSITLTAISGCEYRLASGSWQDSPTFTGLTIATSYSFTQRLKETVTHFASPISPAASLSTAKGSQTAPSAPTMASRTGTSITLTAISGCEYKRDSGAWQDSTAFTGLSPVTSYTFYARKKETATLDPSPASAGASITTDKGTQTAPAAPTVTDIEHDSAKVTSVAGAEVRLGAGSWFDTPKTFTGLTAETNYTAYARLKETVTLYASPVSSGKAFQTTPENDDIWGTPGPKNLVAGTMQEGYFGLVTSAQFITGDALASAITLTNGTSQNSTTDWLKLASGGKILFTPMKTIRHSISWDHIFNKGAVWGDGTTGGDRTVQVQGFTFKVRLFRGLNNSYNPKTVPAGYDGVHCHGSEWNRLILPLHVGAKTGSWGDYGSNVESGLPYWGTDFTDADLQVANGNGRASWCQNYAYSSAARCYRGGDGVADSAYHTSSVARTYSGWRPVLELVTD